MTADEKLLAAVYIVDPGALERARRLCCAMDLVRSGVRTAEANRIMRERFGISRFVAWESLSMAADLAAPESKAVQTSPNESKRVPA